MDYLGGEKVCLFDELVHHRPEMPSVYLRRFLDESLPLRVDAFYESCSAISRHDVERDFRPKRNCARLHVDSAVIVVRVVRFQPLESGLSLDYASLHKEVLDAVVELTRASRRKALLWHLVECRPKVRSFSPVRVLELFYPSFVHKVPNVVVTLEKQLANGIVESVGHDVRHFRVLQLNRCEFLPCLCVVRVAPKSAYP